MQEEVDSDIDENESGGSTSPVVQDEGVWQRHQKREYTETQVKLSPRTGGYTLLPLWSYKRCIYIYIYISFCIGGLWLSLI